MLQKESVQQNFLIHILQSIMLDMPPRLIRNIRIYLNIKRVLTFQIVLQVQRL